LNDSLGDEASGKDHVNILLTFRFYINIGQTFLYGRFDGKM